MEKGVHKHSQIVGYREWDEVSVGDVYILIVAEEARGWRECEIGYRGE